MSMPFLDYGVARGDQRQVYGTRAGSAASDAWYLYQYLEEIRDLRRFIHDNTLPADQFPRKEKYFLLHALLDATSTTHVTELGSSLMEIIDGLEAARSLLGSGRAHGLCFRGIEPSECLADASRLLHPTHDLTLFRSVSALEAIPAFGGIIYDRIVSSSAFRDVDSLSRFLARFDAGILNLLTSREDTFVSEFLGSDYTYFSLAELGTSLRHPLFHLFGMKAPKHAEQRAPDRSVVEGFFFYGDPALLEVFASHCQASEQIGKYWREKQITPRPITTLL